MESVAQADRLKAVALEFACKHGLSALSARSLAGEVGGSPSAVNYYFGGRERLLSSVYHDAMEWSQTIRSGAISKCVDAAPTWADLPHVFSSVVQARLEEERGLSMLLQELEQEAVTGREPSLRELAAEEVDREWRFWMDLAARFGSSLEEATVWTELALGLTGLLLCEPSPAVRSSWITGPAVRLHQRMGGQQIIRLERRDELVEADDSAAVTNETAKAILEAALTVVATKGADHLVQREVATMAGVSLAAVTYFFRTKQDLIYATFKELRQRLRERVRAFESYSKGSTGDGPALISDRETLTGLGSLNALLRAAARDSSLAPIASVIRQLRGVGSFVMLSRKGLSADWLDSYLWAMLISGRFRQVLLRDPTEQIGAVEQTVATTLQIVFNHQK